MKQKIIFIFSLITLLTLGMTASAYENSDGKASLDTVMSFMGAMGGGDMKKMSSLMDDNMVWHNEGDPALPWVGPWKGKKTIFKFLGDFSKNVQVTHWENQDAFASGDTVAVFGEMKLKTLKSGKETKKFTFALRAKVKNGKLILWNWFEDSHAVSKAFHGK